MRAVSEREPLLARAAGRRPDGAAASDGDGACDSSRYARIAKYAAGAAAVGVAFAGFRPTGPVPVTDLGAEARPEAMHAGPVFIHIPKTGERPSNFSPRTTAFGACARDSGRASTLVDV